MKRNLMNKDLLETSLSLLKQGRQRLIQKFVEEEPELYRGFFTYKSGSQGMRNFKDMFFLLWINEHFETINMLIKQVENINKKKILKKHLLKTIFELLQFETDISHKSDLYQELINNKLEGLKYLLNIDFEDMKRYNQLVYSKEKDKVLFQREFKKLKGE